MSTPCSYRNPVDNDCLNLKDKEQIFLDSLSHAYEISVRLIERRDPQNFMQGIFSVELTSKASPDSSEISFILTKNGIRNPASSWPVFTFLVDDSQRDLLWNGLLPALKDTPTLRTLTLQGCSRIPGFYTCLLQTITVSSLTTLNLASWVDFSSSVDWTVATSRLKQVEHLSVMYYKWDETSTRQMCTLLSSINGSLQTLTLKTGTMPREFWGAMKDGLQGLVSLRELSWRGNLESMSGNHGDTEQARQQQMATIVAMEQACRAISSLRQLTNLEVEWNTLPFPCIREILLSHKGGMQLSTLSLSAVDTDGSHVLGDFLEADSYLTSLNVAVTNEDTDVTRLLEGVIRHSALIQLSLSNVTIDNDSAKTTLKLLVYNNVLQDFTLASKNMDCGYLQDVLVGLRYNTTLQSARFPSPSFALNFPTCFAIQDFLVGNSSLLNLHLGDCQLPSSDDDCACVVADGVMANSTLRSLCGLSCGEATASIRSIMTHALESNMTLVEFPFFNSSSEATTRCTSFVREVTPQCNGYHSPYPPTFYLDLNKIGRKHILSPNALDAALVNHVLEKVSSIDQMYYLLQARVDWFRETTSSYGADTYVDVRVNDLS